VRLQDYFLGLARYSFINLLKELNRRGHGEYRGKLIRVKWKKTSANWEYFEQFAFILLRLLFFS
jgi:hypothetical protein